MPKPSHRISEEILNEGLAQRDQALWEDINDQIGAFFTGEVYVAEQHNLALQAKVDRLENALEQILIDEGGNFAGNPARWPCYRAAEAIANKPLTQQEFALLQQQIKAKHSI